METIQCYKRHRVFSKSVRRGSFFWPKRNFEKFGVPVSLLVKESSKADEFLNQTNYIYEVIHLERNNKIKQRHDGLKGFFKLSADIKKYNFDTSYNMF